MITAPRLLAASLLLSFAACGGSSSPGSVSGTVHGQAYAIQDAISASVTVNTGTVTIHEALIVLANHGNLCADAASNTEHPNEQLIILGATDVNGATFNTPTVAGTYAIYQPPGSAPPKASTFTAELVDATCKVITTDTGKGTSGTVTLTAISGNAFDGNFDVALDSGDHVTGSFTPEECPALQTVINSTTQPPCT